MKSLTTPLLYTLLALCLVFVGYSVWQGITQEHEPASDPVPADMTLAPDDSEPAASNASTTSLPEDPILPDEPDAPVAAPTSIDDQELAVDDQMPAVDDGTIRVAIIIDDMGYNLAYGRQLARLPGALTLAVLPHSPHGVELAELGHGQGKEIMLHVPMSTVVPRKLDVGGLTAEMSQQEFERTLAGNLASIPHVRGLNNHMGSELTRLQQPMQWLMTTLAQEQLFFIDSRTSVDSVALSTAEAYRVPTRKRDVFLDNRREPEELQRQFDTLIRLAQQHGSAVAIGHPYPETVVFLQQALPQLADAGVILVPVSQLLPPTPSQKPVEPASRDQRAATPGL